MRRIILFSLCAMFVASAEASELPPNKPASFPKQFAAFAASFAPDANAASRRFSLISPHNIWLTKRSLPIRSPWTPYLKRQFTQSFSPEQRKAHSVLINNYKCEAAAKMERAAFISAWPEFAEHFKHEEIARVFEKIIVPGHSRPDQWCRAQRILAPLVKVAREKNENAFQILFRIKWNKLKTNKLKTPEPDYFKALTMEHINLARYISHKLAYCHHHKPAVQLLAQYHKELLAAGETDIYVFYLKYLSAKMGIDFTSVDENEGRNYLRALPSDIRKIKFAFANFSLSEATQKLPYRKQACEIGWNAIALAP